MRACIPLLDNYVVKERIPQIEKHRNTSVGGQKGGTGGWWGDICVVVVMLKY